MIVNDESRPAPATVPAGDPRRGFGRARTPRSTVSTNSTTTTETTRTRTDLAPDVGEEADTDGRADRYSDPTARCQRQFDPHGTTRLGNLVDGRNEAMPDPGEGAAGTDDGDSGGPRRG